MASVLSARTSSYTGASTPTAGAGDLNVYFYVNKPGVSELRLWVRKTGTTNQFISPQDYCWKASAEFKFDATGKDYYFTWDIIGGVVDSGVISADLDV